MQPDREQADAVPVVEPPMDERQLERLSLDEHGGERGGELWRSVPPALAGNLAPHGEGAGQHRLRGRPRGLVECRRSNRPDQQRHAKPRQQV